MLRLVSEDEDERHNGKGGCALRLACHGRSCRRGRDRWVQASCRAFSSLRRGRSRDRRRSPTSHLSAPGKRRSRKRTPGRAQEVLLSEEVPSVAAEGAVAPPSGAASVLRYPEWDYRLNGYRERAVCVHLRKGAEGPQAWVDHTLAERAGLLSTVRRHFEMLRAERVCLRRQLDGDEIDLDACVAARADFMAGLPMPQALYQSHRRAKRDMAALILTDVSGSTDGWVTAHKRVVDVEREALRVLDAS